MASLGELNTKCGHVRRSVQECQIFLSQGMDFAIGKSLQYSATELGILCSMMEKHIGMTSVPASIKDDLRGHLTRIRELKTACSELANGTPSNAAAQSICDQIERGIQVFAEYLGTAIAGGTNSPKPSAALPPLEVTHTFSGGPLDDSKREQAVVKCAHIATGVTEWQVFLKTGLVVHDTISKSVNYVASELRVLISLLEQMVIPGSRSQALEATFAAHTEAAKQCRRALLEAIEGWENHTNTTEVFASQATAVSHLISAISQDLPQTASRGTPVRINSHAAKRDDAPAPRLTNMKLLESISGKCQHVNKAIQEFHLFITQGGLPEAIIKSVQYCSTEVTFLVLLLDQRASEAGSSERESKVLFHRERLRMAQQALNDALTPWLADQGNRSTRDAFAARCDDLESAIANVITDISDDMGVSSSRMKKQTALRGHNQDFEPLNTKLTHLSRATQEWRVFVLKGEPHMTTNAVQYVHTEIGLLCVQLEKDKVERLTSFVEPLQQLRAAADAARAAWISDHVNAEARQRCLSVCDQLDSVVASVTEVVRALTPILTPLSSAGSDVGSPPMVSSIPPIVSNTA